MPVKGEVLPDHIPVNKFSLLVEGLPPILFTEVSEIPEELEKATMPDRTIRSGGNTLPVEFTVMQPEHHVVEVAAMESWFRENKDPVTPTAKKRATLVAISNSGAVVKSYEMHGAFPSQRTIPARDKANEGELAKIEWTMQADQVITA